MQLDGGTSAAVPQVLPSRCRPPPRVFAGALLPAAPLVLVVRMQWRASGRAACTGCFQQYWLAAQPCLPWSTCSFMAVHALIYATSQGCFPTCPASDHATEPVAHLHSAHHALLPQRLLVLQGEWALWMLSGPFYCREEGQALSGIVALPTLHDRQCNAAYLPPLRVRSCWAR